MLFKWQVRESYEADMKLHVHRSQEVTLMKLWNS